VVSSNTTATVRTLTVQDDETYFTYRVYKEAVAVPENIDAIRALCGSRKDGAESVDLSHADLGMRRDFVSRPEPALAAPT